MDKTKTMETAKTVSYFGAGIFSACFILFLVEVIEQQVCKTTTNHAIWLQGRNAEFFLQTFVMFFSMLANFAKLV